MDTQNLKAFVAVAHTRSFSAAADELYLTQPAVSKRINLLEQQLDTRLFDRIGRQVSLTEAGRALLPRANSILQGIADAKQEISDLQGKVRGKFKIVTSHHIGLHRLPSILRTYATEFPNVELDIQFKDSEDAYNRVLTGEFDLGVVTRAPSADPRICSDTIWQDKLVFVAAQNHPLSQINLLTLKEVSKYPALLPEKKFLTTRIVEDLFQKHNLEVRTILSTNYLETIRALISVGYAWGVLPEIMLTDNSLNKLPVKNIDLFRHLDCIYHKERTLSNPAKAFMKILLAKGNKQP
jgi:DNA-binding transcriptional LysR family regulator